MTPQVIVEVLDAAHLAKFVDSPFPSSGMIMLVGPPATLKSSLITQAFSFYPDALVVSDLNINSLMALRDEFISGRYTTLAFTEFEKLYQRKSETSANIEGALRALTDEGFRQSSFGSQTAKTLLARSFVCGAMTYSFYQQRIGGWNANGFGRRIIFSLLRTMRYGLIADYIEAGKPIELDGIERRRPWQSKIPYDVNRAESELLRKAVSRQTSEETPLILMQKIFCVLKWKHGSKRAVAIIKEFSSSLEEFGGQIEIAEVTGGLQGAHRSGRQKQGRAGRHRVRRDSRGVAGKIAAQAARRRTGNVEPVGDAERAHAELPSVLAQGVEDGVEK